MAIRIRKRTARHIENPKDVEEIVNISYEEACEKDLIMRWFGDFGKGSRFNTYDIIDIPKGCYGKTKKNKNAFTTTIGLWVFNKSFIEPFSDFLGYINEPVDADKYDEINQEISYARLEDRITLQELKDFIVQSQIIMSCCSTIAPSHTEAMFDMNKDIAKKKKELEKKYAEGIKNKDLNEIKKFENELIDYTKDLIKDDPCVDMFNSGARSNWGNNFKNMYICRGPIRKTDGSYDTVITSYMDGLQPKDFAKVNDAAVGGPYSRSRKTVDGGYKEKQFTNATQHVTVLPKGSDCGTTRTITVTLTKKNIKDWMYCFVKEGNKYVEITTENRDKYIGKTVQMRYSSMCANKKDGAICEKCMGTLYNRIGIKNVGLGTMICMSSLKNKAMKNFHDSSLKLSKINPDDVF
jgi:hypothetical protein